MTLGSILVPFGGGVASDAALELALRLCQRHGARLTGLLAHGRSDASRGFPAWMSSGARETLLQAISERGREIRARFEARTGSVSDVEIAWIEEGGEPDQIVGAFARYFDLTVVGQEGHEPMRELLLHPGKLALASGRPLIVVPPGNGGDIAPDGPALVAWDGRRAAARALKDALPLLRAHGRTEVLTIGSARGIQPSDPEVTVERYLAEHGVAATCRTRPSGGNDVARLILAAAEEFGASLLVMGAFQHPKLAEDLLGGVTDRILRDAQCPVFLSH